MIQLLRPGHLCKQDAVYWENLGANEFSQPTYAEPVEIKCRWEDTAEQYLAKGGRTLTSKAKVNTDIDIVEGSALMLGKMADVTDEDDPFANGAWEVQRFDKLPTLDAKQFLRTSYL